MLTITIHPAFRAEKAYTLGLLLTEILGFTLRIKEDAGISGYHIQRDNGRKIIIEDHFFAKKKEGEGYSKTDLPTQIVHTNAPQDGSNFTILYGCDSFQSNDNEVLIGADLVASAFFMLTRWEESIGTERDGYQRFPGMASLAYTEGFLGRPVVHEWAACLWYFLQLEPLATKSSLVLSCDVDHPQLWATPLARLRTLAGGLVRGGWKEVRWWLRNGIFTSRDPYDTFDELMDCGEQAGAQVQFNFLGERPRHFDCWYDLKSPFVLDLFEKIKKRGHIIGFHPSREAAVDEARFRSELTALRTVSGAEVLTGRHHYLCFEVPRTWQMWEDAGLLEDSTVGYPDVPGFRCGMCVPFPVFNTNTRQQLRLREQPLVAMEVTFAEYLRYEPAQMLEKIQALKAQVDKHQGQLTLLWHNSSLDTFFWERYRRVFEGIVNRK